MKSIFTAVEGQKLENLVTNVLFHFIQSGDAKSLRRILEGPGTGHLDLTNSQKQKHFSVSKHNGFLDLFFESDNQVLIVENKLDADFTYINRKHQVVKYSDYLVSLSDSRKKIILIIGLKRWKDYYCQELSRELDLKFLPLEMIEKNGVHYYLKYWDDIIFKNPENYIEKELFSYIDEKYFRYSRFLGEDTYNMNNKTFLVVFKTIKILRDTHEILSMRSVGVSNFEEQIDGESFEIGFTARKGNVSIWVGLWSDIPEQQKPIVFVYTGKEENKNLISCGFDVLKDELGNSLLGEHPVAFLDEPAEISGFEIASIIERKIEILRRSET